MECFVCACLVVLTRVTAASSALLQVVNVGPMEQTYVAVKAESAEGSAPVSA